MWMDLESLHISPLKGRTWQGLKERFLKRIFPKIKSYQEKGVDENVILEFERRLQGSEFTGKKVKKRKKAKVFESKGSHSCKSEEQRKPRLEYGINEDLSILKFISKNKTFRQVRGRNLWVVMSGDIEFKHRSWSSIKERFRRFILFNLEKYDLSPEDLKIFSAIRDTFPAPTRFQHKKKMRREPDMDIKVDESDSSRSSDEEHNSSRLHLSDKVVFTKKTTIADKCFTKKSSAGPSKCRSNTSMPEKSIHKFSLYTAGEDLFKSTPLMPPVPKSFKRKNNNLDVNTNEDKNKNVDKDKCVPSEPQRKDNSENIVPSIHDLQCEAIDNDNISRNKDLIENVVDKDYNTMNLETSSNEGKENLQNEAIDSALNSENRTPLLEDTQFENNGSTLTRKLRRRKIKRCNFI